MAAEPLNELDTLGVAKELEESGVPQKQAEAQARIYLRYIRAVIESKLVTKEDLRSNVEQLKGQMQSVEKTLDGKIQDLKLEMGELRSDIKTLTLRLTVRMGSIMVAGIGAFALLVKLT